MAEKARYVDADELRKMMYGAMPHISVPYSSSNMEQALNQQIQQMVQNAFSSFLSNLSMAVDAAAKPYSQCMLCVQRDHDIKPDDPR